MVWQKGVVEFQTFFLLFIPSLVNFVVPAAIMHFFVPHGTPESTNNFVELRRGAFCDYAVVCMHYINRCFIP